MGTKHKRLHGIPYEHVSHCIVATSLRLFEQTVWAPGGLHFIHLLVSSSWHMGAYFNVLVAKANAQPVLCGRDCPFWCWPLSTIDNNTAPPICTTRCLGGSRRACSQLKPSRHFSDKQVWPQLGCPCVIHFLILRAGLYFYLNSIASSQTQPNYSKQWGSTFRG